MGVRLLIIIYPAQGDMICEAQALAGRSPLKIWLHPSDGCDAFLVHHTMVDKSLVWGTRTSGCGSKDCWCLVVTRKQQVAAFIEFCELSDITVR